MSALEPKLGEAMLRRALVKHRDGDLAAAARLYREVLGHEPERADIAHLLGLALVALGDITGGIEAMVLSLRLAPDVAAVERDLGGALLSAGRADRACAHLQKSVALDSDAVAARINLGLCLARLGREAEARAEIEAALAREPDNAEAHYRLARLLAAAGDGECATAAYRDCLAADGEHWEARYHLADLLLAGDVFVEGWEHYEARWHLRGGGAVPKRRFAAPDWDGGALAGRTILVWGEQGIGEEIFFASMIGEVAAAAERVTVECDPRLMPLFARSFAANVTPVGRTTPTDAALVAAPFALQCAAGSLARHLRGAPERFPHRAFLVADAAMTAAAGRRQAALGEGLRVGVSWRSQAANKRYRAAKSSSLADWGAILSVPGVRFVNLQYGDCGAELAGAESRFETVINVDPEVDQMASLDALAAQIAALDLVIATSVAAAHLAAALGVETWVLMPHRHDWRWLWREDSSLWYPRARRFRQPAAGDWRGLAGEVAAALGDRVRGGDG